jgi:cullin 3
MPEIDLKCNLIPLLGIKILSKTPTSKEFQLNDQYTLNGGFKHNQYKIRIPIAHAKENKQTEKTEVSEKVDEDRRHMVEATIVKVMKTRRRIEHNALLTEATKILSQKFNPDPVMIKKRIESLIDREYMERDADDRRFYKYIT